MGVDYNYSPLHVVKEFVESHKGYTLKSLCPCMEMIAIMPMPFNYMLVKCMYIL